MSQKLYLRLALAGASALVIAACSGERHADADKAAAAATKNEGSVTEATVHPEIWPLVDAPNMRNDADEARIAEMLKSMTLEEKVGQVIQGDISSVTPEDLLTYRLGSILNGGNSAPGGDNHTDPSAYLKLADAFYDASINPAGGAAAIPVMWGTDAVHGHSNIIGATVFPHNIGLGATRDPELIREIGKVTATEVQVTGMEWTFAPTLAVVRDDRWGRTYEGYSEDPEIARLYAGAMVEGLQGKVGTDDFLGPNHVLATAKHFFGDGSTKDGVDQGDNLSTEEEMRDIHAAGYPPAIEAGVQTVMASFNSWHGRKMHGYKEFLTDVLVDRMHFDGFVVGDWNAQGQVEGCTTTSCPKAFNAGLDMFMAADSWKGLYENTLAQVKSGEISMERLDEAVARILRVKLRYGLFDRGRPSSRPNAGKYELLGSPEHRAVARRAVRESLVLLKNNDGLLPLDPKKRILVAGDGADNFSKQTGGWTITWQGEGNTKADFPHGQTIYDGLSDAVKAAGGEIELSATGDYDERPDAAIVVFGENPYAEFQGDRKNLNFEDEAGLETLKKLQAEGVPTVAVFLSGRPMYVNPEINASTAFVAAWLPGSQGGGVADVLLAKADGTVDHDFSGKLSYSWPRTPFQTPLNRGDEGYDPQFAYGFGLTYEDDGDLATLAEVDKSTCEADSDAEYIRAGRARSPYRMSIVSGGETVFVEGPAAQTSNGAMSIKSIDRNAQEDAREIVWTGAGEFVIDGAVRDMRREANANMAISFGYNVIKAPEGDVRIGIRCGRENCEQSIDFTDTFTAAAGGGWSVAEFRLNDLVGDPTAHDSVTQPFVIMSDGPMTLQVSDARLTMPADQRAACEEE